jgi:hypothetical protein
MDFTGKVKVQIPSEYKVGNDILTECKLLRDCYFNYYSGCILDSHRAYCAKFVAAINRFEEYAKEI